MKAGCYLSLAMLTGIVLGYHALLQKYLDPPELWWVSGVMGLLIWFCIGAVWNGLAQGSTIRALVNARDGMTPHDGTLSAIEGHIHPYGEPTIAPLSQEPCVIYEYEIKRTVSSDGHTREVIDFSGIGMTACEVRSEHQTIALYGLPEIDEFSPETSGLGWQARAKQLVRTTPWEDYSGLKVLHGFSALMGTLTSNNEEIHKDFRMVGPGTCSWLESPEDDAETIAERRKREDYQPRLSERRIAVGQKVLAIGKYNAETESFSTTTGTVFQRPRLLRSSLSEALTKARGSRRSLLLGGVLSFLIIHGIALGVFWIYFHSTATQKKFREQLRTAVEQDDLTRLAILQERGVDLQQPLDTDENRALHLVQTVGVARFLLDQGADVNCTNQYLETPLMFAAKADRLEMVNLFIDAKADVNRQRKGDQGTALSIAEGLFHMEIAARLRAVGAVDDVVTAENGTAITAEHPAFQTCVKYVQAIYARDPEQLRAQYLNRYREGFSAPQWEAWQGTRPEAPQLDEGYANDRYATVKISGMTAGGFHAVWVIQLQSEEGEWRIDRERWVTE